MAGILTFIKSIYTDEESYMISSKPLKTQKNYQASQFPRWYLLTKPLEAQLPLRTKSRQESPCTSFHSKPRHKPILSLSHYHEYSLLKHLGKKCIICKRLKCICY